MPLSTGIYIAVLIFIANSDFKNTALFATLVTLAYLAASITYEAIAGNLRFERVAEISVIALLFQYLVLFV